MSISGGLRQKRDFQFVDPSENLKNKEADVEKEEDDGMITINRSDLINKDDYEREKLRQASRADFVQEQQQRVARLMPNRDDKQKNNLRSLVFDTSGNLEQDRATSQKTFQNSRKKYGW